MSHIRSQKICMNCEKCQNKEDVAKYVFFLCKEAGQFEIILDV